MRVTSWLGIPKLLFLKTYSEPLFLASSWRVLSELPWSEELLCLLPELALSTAHEVSGLFVVVFWVSPLACCGFGFFCEGELKWSFPLKVSGGLAPDMDSWKSLASMSGVHIDYIPPFFPIKLEQWKK